MKDSRREAHGREIEGGQIFICVRLQINKV